MNAHEFAFARHFIDPHKRNRYEMLLGSRRGRAKLMSGLCHMGDMDLRFTYQVPNDWTREFIFDQLKCRGAPAVAYLMSAESDLDGRELPLDEALKRVCGAMNGTLVSCLPGLLAFLETEDGRYLLERCQE